MGVIITLLLSTSRSCVRRIQWCQRHTRLQDWLSLVVHACTKQVPKKAFLTNISIYLLKALSQGVPGNFITGIAEP
jgi:hypothetical protein